MVEEERDIGIPGSWISGKDIYRPKKSWIEGLWERIRWIGKPRYILMDEDIGIIYRLDSKRNTIMVEEILTENEDVRVEVEQGA